MWVWVQSKLVPVEDIFERQGFDRRAGNGEAVNSLAADLLLGAVEGGHMVHGRIPQLMAGHLGGRKLHPQRRGAEQARELGFGPRLVWHEV